MVLGKLDGHCHRMQLEPLLTPDRKLNSKWIIDLNMRPDTLKHLEENLALHSLTLTTATSSQIHLLEE